MLEFLDGEKCRRIIMDREMDGRFDRRACEMGEERCDICVGKPRGKKRRRIRVGFTRDSKADFEQEEEDEQEGEDKQEEGSEQEGQEVEVDIEDDRQEVEDDRQEVEDDGQEVEDDGQEVETNDLAREEFEEEKRQQEALRWQRVEERVVEGIRVQGLEEFFELWQGSCMICLAKRRLAVGHNSWKECQVEVGERESMAKAIRFVGQVHLEKWAGCSFCLIPQAVCHLWEEDGTRGPMRQKRVGGGRCQFDGVLIEITTALLWFRGDGELDKWLLEQVRKSSTIREIEGFDNWERVKIWLGRKIVVGGMEISEMCRMVYTLGNR